MAKSDGSELPRKIFDTFGEDLMWASDSELVYWQRKTNKIEEKGKNPRIETKESVRIITLSGQENTVKQGNNLSVLIRSNDGAIAFFEGDAVSGNPVVVRHGKNMEIRPSRLLRVVSHYPPVYDSRIKGPVFHDTDIWIESLDKSYKKRVTYDKQYDFPHLSPDGTKILVDNLATSDLVVLDTNGNELANLGVGVIKISEDLRSMIVTYNASWSPDNKKILYLLDTESERKQDVVNCDIYIVSADGSGRMQVTDTPNEIEMDPEWSPDGSKVACYSENTGKIFVIKLK